MPFRQVFERQLNREMGSTDDAGPSSQRPVTPQEIKYPRSPTLVEQEIDYDQYTKKDTAQPPRFSTLYPPTQQSRQAPEPTIIYQQPPALPSRSKRGITLSLPLFILFVAIIFFESTLLFAYTIIGLYNNVPGPLAQYLPHAQCNYAQPPPILSPAKDSTAAVNNNFYLGDSGIQPGLGLRPGKDSNLVLSMPTATTTIISTTSLSSTTTSSSSSSTASTETKVFTETSTHIIPPSVTATQIVTAAPTL